MPSGTGLVEFNGVGHEVRDGRYGFDVRRRRDRPHVVLQFTLDGVGWHEGETTGRTLLPFGHVFLERFPGRFSYGTEGQHYELIFLSLRGPVAEALADQAAQTFGPCFAVAEPAGLAADLQALNREARTGPLKGDPFALSSRLYAIVAGALSKADAARRAGAEGDPLVGDTRRLIDRHAGTRDFSVAALAERLGVSREHLTRTFSRRTGTTPADAIAQTRLRLAASLLRSTDRSLDDIARRSGFAGANYLCRQFRKKVGVTPTDFRQRRWLAGP
ncbi:MAG: AraC family transcriptional regulator [Planctomycetota bacterium]